MEHVCGHCQEQFEGEAIGSKVPFCSTYCEQSWWMSSDAAAVYDELPPR